PYRAVGLERQAVLKAARNGHDRTQTAYLNRRGHSFVSGGVKVAIAQLTLAAPAPRPDCSIGLQGQAVLIAARNRRGSSQTAYLDRCSHSSVSGGVKVAIAQLAILAVAPRQRCGSRKRLGE